MKSLLATSFLLGLAAAVAVPSKAVYDGAKVIRVKDSAEVKNLIKTNSLSTWIEANGNVDVVVPPGVDAFDGLESLTMHEDLGASITKESEYDVYAGA